LRDDKPVQAKLQPEPNNDYDQHAIADFINYHSGWEKAGYIAKELRSDLHPFLERNNLKTTVQLHTFASLNKDPGAKKL